MMPRPQFILQGHRGARGLKPENTLPAFEAAFDADVTSVETDLHLTRDGVPIISHDPHVSEKHCRLLPGSQTPDPATRPLIASLTLTELRGYRADRNPDPGRFLEQDPSITPVAENFVRQHGIDPFTLPTLAELFAFAAAYAGNAGMSAGKSETQRKQATRVGFDLELKRVPARPELMGDQFDGLKPGILELRLLEAVRAAGLIDRTTVRSFDHRSVLLLRQQEPGLTGAVLIAGTRPLDPVRLAREADADIYCPDVAFLDRSTVEQCHAAGVHVLPWTVNDPPDWARLLDWQVDGITTDYPDRLAEFLRARNIDF